jgi:hypothetical protein
VAPRALAQDDSKYQSAQPDRLCSGPVRRLDTKYVDYHLPINFQNSTFIEVGKNPSYEYLAKEYVISPAKKIAIPPGAYRYSEYFMLLRTDSGRKISGNGRWAGGLSTRDTSTPTRPGATYRHSNKLTAAFNYTHNNISLGTRPFQDQPAQHARQLRLHDDDLSEFADSIQQRHAPVELERAFQHHSPAAQRYIYRVQRAAGFDFRKPCDRALIAKMTYMISR